jgi:hypothetical protein
MCGFVMEERIDAIAVVSRALEAFVRALDTTLRSLVALCGLVSDSGW